MYDSTSLLISLKARETPKETETPATPAPEPAMDAAIEVALIVALSSAVSSTSCAEILFVPSPSIKALTNVRIRFSVATPEPLTATPATPPPPMATEPAKEMASMVSSALASRVISPNAVTSEFMIKARTCAASSLSCGRTSFQDSTSPKSSLLEPTYSQSPSV